MLMIYYTLYRKVTMCGSHCCEHSLQGSILRGPIQMSGSIPPKVLGVQNDRRTRAEFRPRVYLGEGV
jgi:hypothetical protein